MTNTGMDDAQLNRLWGAVCAFAGVFFLLWALSWVNASVLHEDLPNVCGDLHTARFPFEKSCTREDGTVEGANSPLFEGIFFGSMSAGAVCLAVACGAEHNRHRRRRPPQGRG